MSTPTHYECKFCIFKNFVDVVYVDFRTPKKCEILKCEKSQQHIFK